LEAGIYIVYVPVRCSYTIGLAAYNVAVKYKDAFAEGIFGKWRESWYSGPRET
jgi:hypothetical protein